MTWGAHEYFMHPIFVLKNGCDTFAKDSNISVQSVLTIDDMTDPFHLCLSVQAFD
jgi:hypothetical protein